MKKLMILMALTLYPSTIWANKSLPFVVKEEKETAGQKSVLLKLAGYVLIKIKETSAEAYQDLYALNLTELDIKEDQLAAFGEVHHYFSKKMAIIEIEQSQIEGLARELYHTSSMNRLIKIFPYEMAETPHSYRAPPAIMPHYFNNHILTAIEKLDSQRIADDITFMENMGTRYHTSSQGRLVAQKLQERLSSFIEKRTDITMELIDHGNNTPQKSFIIHIEGVEHPDEIIILGSHIDSINANNSGSAPGADDNASGAAVTLEVLRVIVEQNLFFSRSIEIHGYAAEEIGLVGSQDIAGRYKQASKKVIAMFQNDMNLYRADDQDKIWFITTNSNQSLISDLIDLNEQYLGLPTESIAFNRGSSDHESWTRQGYKAVLPSEDPYNYNPNIHSSSDTLSRGTNNGHMSQSLAFCKLNMAFLASYAGLLDLSNEQETPTEEPSSDPQPDTQTDDIEDDIDNPADLEDEKCGCFRSKDRSSCLLVDKKRGRVISWTPIDEKKLCDQAFCEKYFVLGVKSHCNP